MHIRIKNIVPSLRRFLAKRALVKKYPDDPLARYLWKAAKANYLQKLSKKIESERRTLKIVNDYYKEIMTRDGSGNVFYKAAGMKFPVMNWTVLITLMDLWFPYQFDNWNEILSGEGTYEQFGVCLEDGDVVFDLGANVGVFSVFAARKKCSVYAFEPVGYIYDLLCRTLELNSAQDIVTTVNMGVSDQYGEADIFLSEVNIGANTIMGKGENGQRIKLTTIDQFVKDNQISKLDFIKADIEGAERLMLEGAKETLKNLRPKLAICTYHNPDDKDVLTSLIREANPAYKISYSSHKLFARCPD